jgi:hypothetical protein
MTGTRIYSVISAIRHGGRTYEAGETVEMPPALAAPLLALGRLADPSGGEEGVKPIAVEEFAARVKDDLAAVQKLRDEAAADLGKAKEEREAAGTALAAAQKFRDEAAAKLGKAKEEREAAGTALAEARDLSGKAAARAAPRK